MEKLPKDLIGEIFKEMTPLDWICTSVVSKSWWTVIRKWMTNRKREFIKHVNNESLLFGISLINEKSSICLRPLYYLQSIGTGCGGNVKEYVCARHRILSLYNREICVKCLEKPSSDKCFGDFCNSVKCRNYIYVLREGKAERVKSYACLVSNCSKKTDVPKGLCFSHALKSVLETEEDEDEEEKKGKEGEEKEGKNIPRYKCIGRTKNGTQCKHQTISRIFKCHQHISSPISFL